MIISSNFTESTVEQAALASPESIGWAVRNNVKTDWTLRENVRAQLRVLVKRILRKHGYPPEKQEKATQTVLAQAEILSQEDENKRPIMLAF